MKTDALKKYTVLKPLLLGLTLLSQGALADTAPNNIDLDDILKQNSLNVVATIKNELQNNGMDVAGINTEELELRTSASLYALTAFDSDEKFKKIDKSTLPLAPKDQDGHYFIDMSAPTAAITLPTIFGPIAINVDSLRFNHRAGEKRNQADLLANKNSPAPKSSEPPLTYVNTLYVSSQNTFPTLEYVAGSFSTSLDHGGGWIGAMTLEVGYGQGSPAKICGSNMSVYNDPNYTYPVVENGVIIGWVKTWSLATACNSGYFQYSLTSINAPWNTLSDSVFVQ